MNKIRQNSLEVTTDTLLNELRDFADNNPDFRRGTSSQVTLSVMASEPLENGKIDGDYLDMGYEFIARRGTIPDSAGRNGHFTVFDFALIEGMNNLKMLPYLAQQAYGIDDPSKALQLAGEDTAVTRRLQFSVSTLRKVLYACESYTYTTQDGDTVGFACSCEDDEARGYMHGYADEPQQLDSAPEDLDSMANTEDNPAGQAGEDTFSGVAWQHEKIIPATAEEALLQWQTLENISLLEQAVNDPVSKERKRLTMAHFVFSGMKKALTQQLGLA